MSNEQNNHNVRLGVNLDHVATVRQARGTAYPDLMEAIRDAEKGGADGITMHLREDRRHIQDTDVYAAKAHIQTSLNLEMAMTEEMVTIACDLKPDFCCIVPEKRAELTTEGGLDILANTDYFQRQCQTLQQHGIVVSLFVEPDREVLECAARIGAAAVELHTGRYADEVDAAACAHELQRLCEAAQRAHALGLTVNAGHGLRRDNVYAIASIDEMNELNIGHAIVADALFVGLETAVGDMKRAMQGL